MRKDFIHLTAVGDVTLGDHPVCFGHGVRSQIDKYGFDFLFEHVTDLARNSDIVFGNLETVLTDSGKEPMTIGTREFRGKTEYAADLARKGFNVMSVANNHAMQYGTGAFDKTVNTLRDNGVSPIGIAENGKSNVHLFRNNGIEIAMIAYSLRPEKYVKSGIGYATGDLEKINSQISSLYNAGSIVIISLHWGEEYLNYPSPEQVSMAHAMIDAGASLIIGHHPHVLQGIERYKHGYVAYSLGNFIADFWQLYARESLILECDISRDGIKNIDYTPLLINRNYQPEQASGETLAKRKAEILQLGELIDTENLSLSEDAEETYQDLADRVYRKYRIECYLYFLRNIYRYSPSTIIYSFSRFLTRRIQADN